MKKYTELLDYEPARNWLIGFDQETRRNYIRFLGWFCEYTGKNPDQLMQWVKEDRTRVHLKTKEFYQRLATRDMAATSRTSGYQTIRSFFKHNDYPLGSTPRYFRKVARIKDERLLTPREASDLLTCTRSIRSKAIISFLGQSGQRVGVPANLKYGAIRKEIERGISPIVVEMRAGAVIENGRELIGRNKGNANYRFAFGRESREYIMQMLNKRRHGGETINDDTPLFRTTYAWSPDHLGKWMSHVLPTSDPGRAMNTQTLNECVVRAAYAAGIQVEKVIEYPTLGVRKTHHEVHAGSLRIYWKHRMRAAGITDSDLLDFMMGHRPRYGGIYDRFDAEYVRKEYAKAEPTLNLISLPKIVEGDEQAIGIGTTASQCTQRIVTESDLESQLQLGWTYVTTLPSGRIVVQNNTP